MNDISVLMYHAISSDDVYHGYSDRGDMVYVVGLNDFESQLKYLHDNSYKSHLVSELPLSSSDRNNIVITFDDGHISNYQTALPLLQKYGFKATFFITTEWIGTKYYMNESQIQKLSESGMEIGSHGHTHRFFDDLLYDEIVYELSQSQKILMGVIGKEVNSFAAPGGRLNKGYKEICDKLNIKFICTSKVGCVGLVDVTNIYRIAIVNSMSLLKFSDVVTCNFLFFFKSKIKYLFLTLAKRMLGNEMYVKLRSFFV